MLSIFEKGCDMYHLKYDEFDGKLFKIVIIENPQFDYSIPISESLKKVASRGYGNGYVCLPEYHPFFKLDFGEIPVNINSPLTFSDLSEKENLWVIGFDTSKYGLNLNNCPFELVKKMAFDLENKCATYKPFLKTYKILKLKDILS